MPSRTEGPGRAGEAEPRGLEPRRVRIARRVIVGVAGLASVATFVMGAGALAGGSLAFSIGEVFMFWLSSVVAAWIAVGVHRGHRALQSFLSVVLGFLGAGWAGFFGIAADAVGAFDSVWEPLVFIVSFVLLTIAAVAGLIVFPWDLARSREDAARTS